MPIILAAEKKWIAMIPPWLRPLIAGLLGPALDLVTASIAHAHLSPTLIGVSGVAGVGLREIWDQAKQQLTSPLPEVVTAKVPPSAPPSP